MCEHSRRRYAARVVRTSGIPESRMSQLPTNPMLAALPMRYNRQRRHSSLGYIFPAEQEAMHEQKAA